MTPARPIGPIILALDVGTTGVKAAAFDLASPWRHVAIREYPLLEPRPGWQVQDPESMMSATAAAAAECTALLGGADTVAVVLSSAMHGLLALDAGMRPLTPLITWADARATEQARFLRTSSQAGELHRATGAPIHPMTPLTKLMWFAHHDPQTWARARWWVGLKDYLLLRITGKLVTELSSASGTGMLDMASGTWSSAAVALSGVSVHQLPPIVGTTATLALSPGAAQRLGLPAGTPVVAGAADGPLGNLGTGAISPGVAGLSLGTSGAIRMAVPKPQVDEAGALFCYALTEAVWVVGGAVSNGAVVIRWAGDSLAPDLSAPADGLVDETLLRLASTVPAGSEGLVMFPYLLAERAPLWDPDLPGAYLGLRRGHTRAHLVRAAVEGVCRQLAVITDSLDRVGRVSSVRVTGGAFRAPLWREIMAASLNRPLHLVAAAEGSALGAAALGLFALGRAAQLTDAVDQLTSTDDAAEITIDPDAGMAATYAELRQRIPGLVAGLHAISSVFGGDGSVPADTNLRNR
jgi:gluconokinase